jgi:hypothetical protein
MWWLRTLSLAADFCISSISKENWASLTIASMSAPNPLKLGKRPTSCATARSTWNLSHDTHTHTT